MSLTLTMKAPASGIGPVVPANLMPSGGGYVIDSNGQIQANPLDVGMLLGFGFSSLNPASIAALAIAASGDGNKTLYGDGSFKTPGGGGLTLPLSDGLPTTPSLYGSDSTSGFGFDATTGLPGITQSAGAAVAMMSALAGLFQQSPAFQVSASSGNTSLFVVSPNSGTGPGTVELDGFGSQPEMGFVRASGSVEAPTAVLNGNVIARITYSGYTVSDARECCEIVTRAAEDFTSSHLGVTYSIATCKIGDNNETVRIEIGGDGSTSISNGFLILSDSYLVADLPMPSINLRGAQTFVTDALAPAFATAVAGLGTVFCPVYCDGTQWLAG